MEKINRVASNMYYLYILKCSDQTLYTGIAIDLKKRVREHNSSKLVSKYTAARRPVKLVYQKKFRNRSTASREEYRIKQLSKKEKLKLILCRLSLTAKKAGGKKLLPRLVKRQIRTCSLKFLSR